jgi:hypothetical protein
MLGDLSIDQNVSGANLERSLFMITKTITFTDLNGNEITEQFFFNLSKAELINMQTREKGGLDRRLRQIAESQDVKGIVDVIEEFIMLSYGEKAEDGIGFIKVKNGTRLAENFRNTDAYSELFMELVSDPDKLTAFLTGIMPKDLSEKAQLELAKQKANAPQIAEAK